MSIVRRDFLNAGAAAATLLALPATARAYGAFSPQPGAWRRFELRTRVEIVNAAGTTQARIPVPSLNEADWFRTEGSKWTTNSRSAALVHEPNYGAGR